MKIDRSDEGLLCSACKEKSTDAAAGLRCADRKNIFTRREQKVLDRILQASLRAGALKAEINRTDGRAREAALPELERLRPVRAEFEKERLAPSQERVRLLGHL